MNIAAASTLCAFLLSSVAAAQQAVSVSGHITAEGRALAGASVRVPALGIERTTDRAGYYSFLIPSNRVGGQTVRLTASFADRRVAYVAQTVEITLSGRAIVRDFDLQPVTGERPARPDVVAALPAGPSPASRAATTDTLGLAELSGPTDISTALAARFPSLGLTTSSALGGSSSLAYRGIRSLLGSAQPLVVVNGVIQDNTTFTSLAQRYGAGGFDYGSPLQDVDTRDVASIRWLAGPDASALYGSRAANGVVVIETKDGSDAGAFAVGARQEISSGSTVRLPSYQNAYGQGLGGQFQFFDGRGNGINDGVAENWGPALDGQPRAQASYAQPRQADVRFWNPRPNNVDRFFRDANTLNTNITVQGRSDLGSAWLGLGSRASDGIAPEARLRRRDARLSAATRPGSALSLSATLAVAEMKNDDAIGSGFNQTNPASQLTRLGRQVEMDSLRAHVRTADGQQISWNYAGQNNPFFAALANDNARDRNHLSGGASARYAFDSSLTLTALAGSDYYRDDRRFTIASGWMGGFPFYASDGLFTQGGFQSDNVAAQRSNGLLRLEKTRTAGDTRWTFFGGGDLATIHQRVRTVGIDSVQNVPPAGDTTSTLEAPAPASWTGHGKTLGVAAGATVASGTRATLAATLRHEWVTVAGDHQAGQTYPSVQGSLDVAQFAPALRFGGLVDQLNLKAGWSRSGTDATPYAVQTMYAGQALSGGAVPVGAGLVRPGTDLGPETTDAWEVGAELSAWNRHVDAGFTFYHERSSDVILPSIRVGDTSFTSNDATLRNQGIEGFLTVRGGDRARSGFWDLGATASLNRNRVEDLGPRATAVLLGPPAFGVTSEAIKGWAFGQLVGYELLRDGSTGKLVLRDGLPQADSAGGRVVLGEAVADKVLGLRGTIGYRWLSLTAAGEGHFGGSFFSSTLYNGDVSGSFSATAFRPDSGLLIDGIDEASGQQNATHVSTEAYYHALGQVQEPWVQSANFFKLRELNVAVSIPTNRFPALPFATATVSLVTRNLYTWSHAKDFDPESILSVYPYPGLELGQLPTVRTIGIQLSIVP
jgi:TonB-dependent SusC/RagA subfamily outer membrane receptor